MLTLAAKIEANQRKHARFKKAEKLLRQLRLKVFDYEDHDAQHGTHKSQHAQQLMQRCKAILQPLWTAQHDARQKAMTDRMMHTLT